VSYKFCSLADAGEENDLLRELFVSRGRPESSTEEVRQQSAYVTVVL